MKAANNPFIQAPVALFLLSVPQTIKAQTSVLPIDKDAIPANATAYVGDFPLCAQTCTTHAFALCECPLGDFTCFCTCPQVDNLLTSCTTFRCTDLSLNATIVDSMMDICPNLRPPAVSIPPLSSYSLTTPTSTPTPPPRGGGTCSGAGSGNGNGTRGVNSTGTGTFGSPCQTIVVASAERLMLGFASNGWMMAVLVWMGLLFWG